jgi:hypothetical protein
MQNHAPRFVEDRFRAEPLPVLDIEIAIQILDAAFPFDHEIRCRDSSSSVRILPDLPRQHAFPAANS